MPVICKNCGAEYDGLDSEGVVPRVRITEPKNARKRIEETGVYHCEPCLNEMDPYERIVLGVESCRVVKEA